MVWIIVNVLEHLSMGMEIITLQKNKKQTAITSKHAAY